MDRHDCYLLTGVENVGFELLRAKSRRWTPEQTAMRDDAWLLARSHPGRLVHFAPAGDAGPSLVDDPTDAPAGLLDELRDTLRVADTRVRKAAARAKRAAARAIVEAEFDEDPQHRQFVDQFLSTHRIAHEFRPAYPYDPELNTVGLHADWRMADGTYVEVADLSESSSWVRLQRKTKLAARHRIPLVIIQPQDLAHLDGLNRFAR